MEGKRVYLDTTVFKFSQTDLPRLIPRKQLQEWGGRTHEVVVYDFGSVNPNSGIGNPALKTEGDLLPTVAEMGKKRNLKFVTSFETLLETFGLADIDSRTGPFYGASYEEVDAPVTYARILSGLGRDQKEYHYNDT